jgi:NAD(P)-dependent dehydrogenase (short-subunit alcohol dehydrogenase family)
MEYQSQQENRPPQHQPRQPGIETEMMPEPVVIRPTYRGSGKLKGKVALITGGDSGIGRSVAVHFAREGAAVAIVYLEEDRDARETRKLVMREGTDCVLIAGDIRDPLFCKKAVDTTRERFGRLDVLVSNAGIAPAVRADILEASEESFDELIRVNLKGPYFLIQRAARWMLANPLAAPRSMCSRRSPLQSTPCSSSRTWSSRRMSSKTPARTAPSISP